MPIVLTVDQRSSRHGPDRVEEALGRLARRPAERPFERTAGDEFQGVLSADPGAILSVVDVILDLVRDGTWSIGIGVGPVEHPLPASTRAGRGEAFLHARKAVERAKRRPQHLAVDGRDPEAARDAEAVLTLLAAVVQRRTPQAWKAVELVTEGLTLSEVAARLGVTRQAVGQRLGTALWHQEQAARPVAARLLAGAGGV
jgi:hypothetical protein